MTTRPRLGAFGLPASLDAPLAFALVAALWMICHPYDGIVGDSSVYLGRILADQDPAGLGRDLAFACDGQSNFSLFRIIARPLVGTFGASTAGALIAALAGLCWVSALVALAHGLAKGRTAWAIVLVIIALPIGYGDTGHFSFGESTAVPRPFAEAAVMGALSAILGQRGWIAAGLLAVALLIHPIMALAGVGVAAVLLLWSLPTRQRIAALAAIAVAAGLSVVLGGFGVPLFDRLVHAVDDDWMHIIVTRGPHLFPTHWATSALAALAIQFATIVIAAHGAAPAPKRLLVAVGLVGAFGFATAILFSDTLHILLFVQIQTWRATWLVAVIAGCALALCASQLWTRDARGRVVLALVALAWFVQPNPLVSCAIVGAALLIEFGTVAKRLPFDGRTVAATYAIVGTLTAVSKIGLVLGYVAFLHSLPVGDAPRLTDPIRNDLQTVPLILLTAVWLFGPPISRRGVRLGLVLGSTLLVVAAACLWDQRPAAARALETEQTRPGFDALMAGRPRAVLWLDGMSEAWFSLRRPQYLSAQQAVGIVFSRPLAMEWRRRATQLAGLGLAQKAILRPFTTREDDDRLHVTQAAIDRFCGLPDAPGAIVMAVEDGASPPDLRGLIQWRPSDPGFVYERSRSHEAWHEVTAYAAVPCADAPTAPAR